MKRTRNGLRLFFTAVLTGTAGLLIAALPARAENQVLYSLGLHANDSVAPGFSSVVRSADGTIYGTASGPLLSVNQFSTPGGSLFRLAPNGTYTNLHLFGSTPSDGLTPNSTPLLASDGNLYGTTSEGDASPIDSSCGTVYRYQLATGAYSIIHRFPNSGSSGCFPSGLTESPDGSLWGVTAANSQSESGGAVYHVNRDGSGFTEVNRFGTTQSADLGFRPNGPLIMGADGNFYGSLGRGGIDEHGAVFSLTPTGTFRSLGLLSGDGTSGTGSTPLAGLVEGSMPGTFYGTTYDGGSLDRGTIFKVVVSAESSNLTRLYNFNDQTRGVFGGLVLAADGSLLGTATFGGSASSGTLFRFNPGNNSLSIVLSFGTSPTRGRSPQAPLVIGDDGDLYGTTSGGGIAEGGTVFRATTAGTLTTLLALGAGPEGIDPGVGLLQAKNGNFYGATQLSAIGFLGNVFRLTASGTLSSLLDFGVNARTTGRGPGDGLIQGRDNYLYGTTMYEASTARGAVFRIAQNGTSFALLHSFAGQSDGGGPAANLVEARDGHFYGTTTGLNTSGGGTLYQIQADGSYSLVAQFTAAKGLQPQGRLIQSSDGSLYGTTLQGGDSGCGTVFRATPSANPAIRAIHSFNCSSDGGSSYAGLTIGSDGNFYGLTSANGANGAGTVFRITPSGDFSVIHDFDFTHGGYPQTGQLALARDGNFYGGTSSGGSHGLGVLFRLTPQGDYRVLHELAGMPADGSTFRSQPIQGRDGALYATTAAGGSFDRGTIIRVAGPADIVKKATAAVATGNVTLSWTTSPRALSYNVYQGATAGVQDAVPVLTGITGTSAVIGGLTQGDYFFTVTAVNDVGETQPSAEVAVAIGDTTPDAFSWTTATNATPNAAYTSEARVITGLTAATTVVSISGAATAQYRINGTAYTSIAGATVLPGDTIRIRVTAGDPGSAVTAALNVGGTIGTLAVTAQSGSDTTPNAFAFTDVTGAKTGKQVVSNTVKIGGIDNPTPVTVITPGTLYSINGDAFTAASGTIGNGDKIRLRMTAPAAGTTTTATIDIGGVTATWSVRSAP